MVDSSGLGTPDATVSSKPIPGSQCITEMRGGVSTGYFCNTHKTYITPLMVRGEYGLIPVCEDCFLKEVTDADMNLGDAEIIEDEDTTDAIISEHVGEGVDT